MASNTETFVFNSTISDTEKSTSAEASPAYTLTSKRELKEEKKPSSVFTLRHTPDGELELTSNRKIIRLTLETNFNDEAPAVQWKWSTKISADVIPTNSDVLKQVEQDVYNDQTKAVLHASRVWGNKKKKAEEKEEEKGVLTTRKMSWWPFKKSKST